MEALKIINMGSCCSSKKFKTVRNVDHAITAEVSSSIRSYEKDCEPNTTKDSPDFTSRRASLELTRPSSIEHDLRVPSSYLYSKEDTASKLEEADLSPFMTPRPDIDGYPPVNSQSSWNRNTTLHLLKTKDLLTKARLACNSTTKYAYNAKPSQATPQLKHDILKLLSQSSGSSDGSLQYSISLYESNQSMKG